MLDLPRGLTYALVFVTAWFAVAAINAKRQGTPPFEEAGVAPAEFRPVDGIAADPVIAASALEVLEASARDAAADRATYRRTAAKLSAGTESGPFLAVQVLPGTRVALRRSPHGVSIGTVGPRTEFGSAAVFSVVDARRRSLGVVTPYMPNGSLAWMDFEGSALRVFQTDYSIRVRLADRVVELDRAGRTVARLAVGVGAPGNETPAGRFGVTDKLDVRPGTSSVYGCCVVALSGHQPNLPPGWIGGDRIAIHGTPSTSNVGRANSAGCLRARDGDVAGLIARIPLGTPVFVSE